MPPKRQTKRVVLETEGPRKRRRGRVPKVPLPEKEIDRILSSIDWDEAWREYGEYFADLEELERVVEAKGEVVPTGVADDGWMKDL